MPESRAARGPAARGPLRRIVLGPVVVTGALVLLAVSAAVLSIIGTGPGMGTGPSVGTGLSVGAGWVLAWLVLGLTAGYALSGSV